MNEVVNEQKQATDLALKLTERFDFDCREVVSSEPVGSLGDDTVFRIVVRLWSSPERIGNVITEHSGSQDVELIREILSEGNKIAIEATHNRVLKQDWLGVQFS